jgi:hypothetical protein
MANPSKSRTGKTKKPKTPERKQFRTIEEVRNEYYPEAARRDRAVRQRRDGQLFERRAEFALRDETACN